MSECVGTISNCVCDISHPAKCVCTFSPVSSLIEVYWDLLSLEWTAAFLRWVASVVGVFMCVCVRGLRIGATPDNTRGLPLLITDRQIKCCTSPWNIGRGEGPQDFSLQESHSELGVLQPDTAHTNINSLHTSSTTQERRGKNGKCASKTWITSALLYTVYFYTERKNARLWSRRYCSNRDLVFLSGWWKVVHFS